MPIEIPFIATHTTIFRSTVRPRCRWCGGGAPNRLRDAARANAEHGVIERLRTSPFR